jgi:hypothetical protein
MSRSYTSSPPSASMACSGTALPIIFYELLEGHDVMKFIKLERLQWAGHIVQMDNSGIPKKVLDGKFHGRRPVGRPRLRWEDIRRDSLLLLNIRGWRR